jgi:hypothetical protein
MFVKYITEKEASHRYGRSRSWFQKRRNKETLPFYKKCKETKRIFYPLQETDRWFKENMILLNDLDN